MSSTRSSTRGDRSASKSSKPRDHSDADMTTNAEEAQVDMELLNEEYNNWKKNSRILYDFIKTVNFEWPVTTAKWSDIKAETENVIRQEIFLSCRTDGSFHFPSNTWTGHPSFLIAAETEIPLAGYQIGDRLSSLSMMDTQMKQKIDIQKLVIHPGEVNCLKPWRPKKNIVATHSDSPYVYVWDLEKQSNRTYKENLEASSADFILEGHTGVAAYALSWSNTNPTIISGGKDRKILLWDLNDHFSPSSMNGGGDAYYSSKNQYATRNSVKIKNRASFEGHTAPIEDCTFHPYSDFEFCSVGDDRRLIIWDTRIPEGIATQINNLHEDDINCVDWCYSDVNYIGTGSSDLTAAIVDLRKGEKVAELREHKKPIINIQWHPSKRDCVATSGDDLILWNLNFTEPHHFYESSSVLYKHAGHRASVFDFDWNIHSPWSFISCSDDSELTHVGGGSLQVWRPLDLLLREKETAIKSLCEVMRDDEEPSATPSSS